MEKYGFVHVAEFGWSAHSLDGLSTLSHYGDSWTTHLDDFTSDCLLVDVRPLYSADLEEMVKFSVHSPIVKCNIPAGMVHTWGEVVEFDGITDDNPFGNARSLSYVGTDVYGRIARAFSPHIIVSNPNEYASIALARS